VPSLASRIPLCNACNNAEQTIVVNTGDDGYGDCGYYYNDGGYCTLRQAIMDANADRNVTTKIEFARGVDTIHLDTSLPAIDSSVCIDGGYKKKSGKVTLHQSNDTAVIFLYENSLGNSATSADDESIEICFRNLNMIGGGAAIFPVLDRQDNKFVHMDVVHCHFEDQLGAVGGTVPVEGAFREGVLTWGQPNSDVSLLRVVDSFFLGNDNAMGKFDCISVGSNTASNPDSNRIEIVNSHLENCQNDCFKCRFDAGNSVIVYGSAFVGCGGDGLDIDPDSVYSITESIFYDTFDNSIELDDNDDGIVTLDRCTIKRAGAYGMTFKGNDWNVEVVSSLFEENEAAAFQFPLNDTLADNKLVLIDSCYDGIDATNNNGHNVLKKITSADTNATHYYGDHSGGKKVCKRAGVTRPDLLKKLRDLEERYYGSYTRAAETLAAKAAKRAAHANLPDDD